MSFTFDIYGSQIDGARDLQEDAFLVTNIGDSKKDRGEGGCSLIVVADGMGGHAAGNVASNMAVQAFNKHVSRNYPNENLSEILYQAIIQGNNFIAQTIRDTPALQGMGCTMVAALFEDKYLRWTSVGDSHLYLIRDKKLIKKNADHSYGGFLARMAAAGTPMEPEPGFSRNMLMSALTGDEIAEIDCPLTPLELQAGDRIILATDGLDTLSHGTILYNSDSAATAKDCALALLDATEEAHKPKQDNTTVVVVDVHARSGPGAAIRPGAATDTVEEEVEEEEEEEELQQATMMQPAPVQKAEPTTKKLPPAPAGADKTQPKPAPQPVEEQGEKKGGKMMYIIVAVVVLALAAGGAAFFFMGGGKPKTVKTETPPTTTPTTPATTPPPKINTPPTVTVAPTPPPSTTETPTASPPTATPAPVGTGQTFRDPLASGGAGPEMVWLAPGTYKMGAGEHSMSYDERPQHPVTIKHIAFSTTEVTMEEYERFATATGRKLTDKLDFNIKESKETQPIRYVAWGDALEYAKWLSKETGKRYRIPTEAEWEYAARAGTGTEYWWGQDIGTGHAHCKLGCESPYDKNKPVPVRSFAANPFGVYDTAGNVSEWVFDCYHKNYDGAPDDGTDFQGGDCNNRVIRGGSYANAPGALRSSKRDRALATRPADEIGIRVVRDE
jgi:formylglycine-generating enzyme required for sulfatase activity/serine/threonine protein phosphatase PrpC